jgi:hypothetical protein
VWSLCWDPLLSTHAQTLFSLVWFCVVLCGVRCAVGNLQWENVRTHASTARTHARRYLAMRACVCVVGCSGSHCFSCVLFRGHENWVFPFASQVRKETHLSCDGEPTKELPL